MPEDISFSQPYTVAVVQAAIPGVTSDATAQETQRHNAQRIAEHIDFICRTHTPAPRLIVYPVLCLTGPKRHVSGVGMETVAIELPGDRFQPIVDACKRNNCYFVSSTQEHHSKLPGKFYHTGFMLGPEGLVLRSPKAQAFSAPETTALRDIKDEYESVFGKGSVLPVAKTDIGVIGCMVESELYVPEVTRLLRSKGAEIIVHPTAEHGGGVPDLAIKQTNAFTNGVYWLSAAPSRLLGYGNDYDWLGGVSAIVGPEGNVDVQAGPNGDGVIIGVVDPERLATARKKHARHVVPAGNLFAGLYS